ncbi:substrate-binding periplasmic protein [Dongshaea marina]|uniref:substrate-binding periplasmic protein n=1 Tax=Dongshaea marina TaxID=2047966 RepID=UPI00131EE5E5|nr:transporter substrate-binding domain-containing protein [Dongshaea marina]
MKTRWLVLFSCPLLLYNSLTMADTELKFATQEFAPFSYTIGSRISGPVVEIIKKVCDINKFKCSFKVLPWSRATRYVEVGLMNGLFVIGWSQERAQWLYFSPALVRTEYGVFVQKDNPLNYHKASDLKDYTVGVYGPSNTANALEALKRQNNQIKIDMNPHDEFPFKKLSVGRVDAVYSNKDAGLALIYKLGLNNIRYAGRDKTLDYHIGFSKRLTPKPVVDQFNRTLATLYQAGYIQGHLPNTP